MEKLPNITVRRNSFFGERRAASAGFGEGSGTVGEGGSDVETKEVPAKLMAADQPTEEVQEAPFMDDKT